MSSPETNPFSKATSCSSCPVGRYGDGDNDDTSCQLCESGKCNAAEESKSCSLTCAKLPDNCVGYKWSSRTCGLKIIVDDWLAGGLRKANVVKTYGNFQDWDVTKITTMLTLFYQKSTLNADVSKWDISNVKILDGSKYITIFFLPSIAFNKKLFFPLFFLTFFFIFSLFFFFFFFCFVFSLFLLYNFYFSSV
jgi:hypothetical protein